MKGLATLVLSVNPHDLRGEECRQFFVLCARRRTSYLKCVCVEAVRDESIDVLRHTVLHTQSPTHRLAVIR
ncbi:hypothetical protein FQZ97_1038650 [compost metagenome]